MDALGLDPEVAVTGRSKKRPAIAAKLLLKPNMRLPQMEDVAGCRVVLPTQEQVHLLAGHSEGRSRQMTFSHGDDYVASPRSGGYRALHLHARRTVTSRGQELGEWRVEIQLRTERQHEWADEVEGFDEAAQTDVKHETAAADVLQYWADRASLLAAWDADRDDAVERQRLKQSAARMRAVLERGVHDD